MPRAANIRDSTWTTQHQINEILNNPQIYPVKFTSLQFSTNSRGFMPGSEGQIVNPDITFYPAWYNNSKSNLMTKIKKLGVLLLTRGELSQCSVVDDSINYFSHNAAIYRKFPPDHYMVLAGLRTAEDFMFDWCAGCFVKGSSSPAMCRAERIIPVPQILEPLLPPRGWLSPDQWADPRYYLRPSERENQDDNDEMRAPAASNAERRTSGPRRRRTEVNRPNGMVDNSIINDLDKSTSSASTDSDGSTNSVSAAYKHNQYMQKQLNAAASQAHLLRWHLDRRLTRLQVQGGDGMDLINHVVALENSALPGNTRQFTGGTSWVEVDSKGQVVARGDGRFVVWFVHQGVKPGAGVIVSSDGIHSGGAVLADVEQQPLVPGPGSRST